MTAWVTPDTMVAPAARLMRCSSSIENIDELASQPADTPWSDRGSACD
jgi:hypothetical protein